MHNAGRVKRRKARTAARSETAEVDRGAARPASCCAAAGSSRRLGRRPRRSAAPQPRASRDLLTNRFRCPARTPSERTATAARSTSGASPTGSFTVVVRGDGRARPRSSPARSSRPRAAPPRRLPTGRFAGVQTGLRPPWSSATIVSELEPADAKGYTDDMREAAGTIPGREALGHGPGGDRARPRPGLRRTTSRSASSSSRSRSRFAASSSSCSGRSRSSSRSSARRVHDPGDARDRLDLRELHGAHDLPDEHGHADRARDRDRLLAPRRLPLPRGAERAGCRRRTRSCARWTPPAARSSSAGRAVAIGLALMLFMPLPFMRGFGIGGLLIPIVSVIARADAAAGAALLIADAARPRAARAARDRRAPRRPPSTASGRGSRARSCAGRCSFAARATTLLLLLAAPVLDLELGAGLEHGHPAGPRGRAGPERRSPPPSARARSPRPRSSSTPARAGGGDGAGGGGGRPAARRRARGRPEVAGVGFGEPAGSTSTRAAATSTSRRSAATSTGSPRRRSSSTGCATSSSPRRGFPEGVEVLAGGGPPSGVDFLDLTYGVVPVARARGAAAHVRAARARVPLAAAAAEGDRPQPALDRRRVRAARRRLQVGRRRSRSG